MKKNNAVAAWIEANAAGSPCLCRCGLNVKPTRLRYYRGRRLDFIAGHQNRGAFHANYKGGQVLAKGYAWILAPQHPRRTRRGYVKKCWLILERIIGRYLVKGETVHHRNGRKLDDRPENLEITNPRAHAKEHNAGRVRNKAGQWLKEANP